MNSMSSICEELIAAGGNEPVSGFMVKYNFGESHMPTIW